MSLESKAQPRSNLHMSCGGRTSVRFLFSCFLSTGVNGSLPLALLATSLFWVWYGPRSVLFVFGCRTQGASVGMKPEERHQRLHVHRSRSLTQLLCAKRANSAATLHSTRAALAEEHAVTAHASAKPDGAVQHAT